MCIDTTHFTIIHIFAIFVGFFFFLLTLHSVFLYLRTIFFCSFLSFVGFLFSFFVWSNLNLFNLICFFFYVVNGLIVLCPFIGSQVFFSLALFFLSCFSSAAFLYSSVYITLLHVLLTKNK